MRLVLLAGTALVLSGLPAHAQSRLVSLGGAVTETVFALAQGTMLVGTDQTSRFPPPAADLPKVGYLRALGAEGVLSLHPELILASADAGPAAAMRQIEAAGVRVLMLPEAHAPDAALRRLEMVAEALGQAASASAIIKALREDLTQVAQDVAALPSRKRVLFLLSAGRGAPMAAGTGTAAEAMIRLSGGVNIVTAFRGYRPLSSEAAMVDPPQAIVTTSETLAGVGGIDALITATSLSQTPAGRNRTVIALDGAYLLGFGPRLAHAQRDLALALHPGAAIRPLPDRPWVSGHP